MRHLLTLIFLAATLLPASTFAKTYPHEEAKVQVDIPDTWKVEIEDDTLQATAPKDAAGLVFSIVEAKELAAALESLEKELSSIVKDMKALGEPEKVKFNGMEGYTINGKGKIEGVDVDLGVMILKAPSGKVIVVLGFTSSKSTEKQDAAIEGIFKSLKPMK